MVNLAPSPQKLIKGQLHCSIPTHAYYPAYDTYAAHYARMMRALRTY